MIATCEAKPEVGELFRSLYPRRYITPFGYLDPKFAYADLACSAHAITRPGVVPPDENAGYTGLTLLLTVESLITSGSPTYFLAQDFGAVLVRSSIQEDLPVKDLKYPCKAAVICLPDALTLQEFGMHIPFMTFNWQTTPSLLERNKSAGKLYPEGMLGFQFLHVRPNGEGVSSWGQIPGQLNIREALSEEYRLSFFGDEPEMTKQEKDLHSGSAIRTLHRFVLQVIMGMTALPQLIDSDTIARKAKPHKKKPIKELWNPRYIGFKYKRMPKPNHVPGTHASPEMHRKNGHWKQQPYGPGRNLRKLIFVDEYWVCVPDEKTENAKRIP